MQTFVVRLCPNDVKQIRTSREDRTWNVFQEHHDALKLFWFTT